jgi:dihydrofolate reductase
VARLVLQMQLTLDGYVNAHDPDTQWQVWDWGPVWPWDQPLKDDFNATFAAAGGILLSRKIAAEGYLDHWGGQAAAHPDDADYAFARKVVELPKFVVTNGLRESCWDRTSVVNGPFAEAVVRAKDATEGSLLVFGGTSFAAALLEAGLVDELQLYVNPTAVGSGDSIFSAAATPLRFETLDSRAYECGIVVTRLAPRGRR